MSQATKNAFKRRQRVLSTAVVLLATGSLAAFVYKNLTGGTTAGLSSLSIGSSSTAALSSPPPPRPPPALLSVEAVEAEITAKYCSAEFREQKAAAVANGSSPPLLDGAWSCYGLTQCSGAFVSETVGRWRSMPQRYESLLNMVPCDLWQQIRNRTLWIVGDSMAQNHYKQLACFLAPFVWPPGQQIHDKLTTDPNYAELINRELVKGWEGAGVAMPFCMRLLGGTMLCHLRVNFGDYMLHVLKHMHLLAARPKRDIVNFNFGVWHRQNRRFIANSFGIVNKWFPPLNAEMVQALADHWKAHKERMPWMVWRDHSPQHFDWPHGEFPPYGLEPKLPTKNCVKLPVEVQPDGTLAGNDTDILSGGWRNRISMPIWKAAGMPIHHTWNDTVMMYNGHTTKGDCTHLCSPGGHLVWIWSLWRTLEELKLPKP